MRKSRVIKRPARVIFATLGVATALSFLVGALLPDGSGAPTLSAPPTPKPSVTSPLPSVSPSPTATPEASPMCEEWEITESYLTAPRLGLENYPIRPTTSEDFVWKPALDENGDQIYNADGTPRYDEMIEPVGVEDVVWYNRLRESGSNMSPCDENTNYFFSHSTPGAQFAPFNLMSEAVLGDRFTITVVTAGGLRTTMTYEVTEVFKSLKSATISDERWTRGEAGRAVFVTCFREGERYSDGRTKVNTVVVAQLVQSVTVSVG